MSRMLTEILKGTCEVSNKIEKLEARNDLLESAMLQLKKSDNQADESEEDDASNSCLKNLGSRTAMEIFSDLIRDCNRYFSGNLAHKK